MIKVLELSEITFKKYGSYNLISETEEENNPADYAADQLAALFCHSHHVSIGRLTLRNREFMIDRAEKHNWTEEIFGGFTADILFFVAAPSAGRPEPETFEVFRLPAGGFVCLKREVWHYAPYILTQGVTSGIVVLPPYTYSQDSEEVLLEQPIRFEAG